MVRALPLLVVACAAAPRPAHVANRAPSRRVPAPVTPEGLFVPDLIARRIAGGELQLVANPTGPIVVAAPERRPDSSWLEGAPRLLARGAEPAATIVIEYCIDELGRVTSARAMGRDAGLAALAVEAVRGWRFAPYFVRGEPITACSYVTLSP